MSKKEGVNVRSRGLWLAALAVLMVCAGVFAFSTSGANASAPLTALKAQAPSGQKSNTDTAPSNGAAGSKQSTVPKSSTQLNGSPSSDTGKVGLPALAAPRVPNTILYDQYNNASTQASNSQQFEAANAAFTDQVADDFPVPAGQSWSVNEVDIAGQYFNGPGPATAFNVYFYSPVMSGAVQIPGASVYTATNQTFTSAGTGVLTFTINLATPAILTSGTYFVSAQAVQNFSPSGQFGWEDRTVQTTNPADFRNPGAGFGCPIPSGWNIKSACVATPAPDQVYRLVGTLNTAGTGTATSTTVATATAAATATCTVYNVMTTTGTIISGTVDTGNHCDDCATTINLPFPVQLYGNTFTTAQVGSNGTLSFGVSNNSFINACLPDNVQTFQINPYWDDQRTDVGTGTGIFTSTVGTTLYIEFRTVLFSGNIPEDYEVVLTQGSPNFSIIYGPNITDSASETVGVQKDTTTFTSYKCNTASPPITPGLRLNFNLTACPTATATLTTGPSSTSTRTVTGTPPTATATCPVPSAGTWTAQAAYPIPVLDEAATSLNGTLYSFSGVSAGALVANSYKYNPSANTWTAIAPLPAARENASAVTDGTYIYILGGANSTGAVTTTLYRYDPTADTYTTLAPFTVGTFAQSAAYLNGKIYRISGCTTPCSAVTNTVEAYTISSNTWGMVAAYPQAYGFIQSVGSGSYVYSVGGVDPGGTASTKTYRYDPTANTWDDASITDLPMGNWGGTFGVLNSRLVLATGYQGTNVGTGAFALSLSNTAGTWVTLPNALQAVGRDSGGVVGSSLYVIGGRDVSGGFNGTNFNQQYTEAGCAGGTGTATVQATNTATVVATASATTTPAATASVTCTPGGGTWVPGPDLPTTQVRSVGVYFPTNGRLYNMGGRMTDSAGSDIQTPYEYNPATNMWTVKAGMIPDNQVNNMACGVLNAGSTPYIYCVGGSAAGAATATARVFYYNPVTDAVTALTGADDWPGDAAGTILPGGFTVANNKLYILGGFNINVASTNQIWEFDPNAAVGSRWTQKVNTPVGIMYAPTTTYNGNVYVLGASDYTTTVIDTNTTFEFNPTSNTIITTIATIPRATGETRALNVGGKLWVLGGGRVAPNPSNEVDVYDPIANSWSTGVPFTTARRNFPADTDGSKVYLSGGYDVSGVVPLQSMEIFQPSVCPGGTPSVTASTVASSTSTVQASSTTQPSTTSTTQPGASSTSTTQPGASSTSTIQPVASSTRTTQPVATSTSTVAPTACALQFTDVPSSGPGSTFYNFVRCLVCRGIVSGYPCGGVNPATGQSEPCDAEHHGYYRPGNNVSRGQLSKIVANSAGLNDPIPAGQQSFSDVPPSSSPSSFYVYIERLARTGAISGYPCNTTNPQTGQFLPCDSANRPYFLPTNSATRGQISKIVALAAGYHDVLPAGEQTFTDVPPNSPFYQYIEELANRHIIDGYDAASGRCAAHNPPYAAPCFLYNDYTTRGQMAKIAANAFFPNCQTAAKPATAPVANW